MEVLKNLFLKNTALKIISFIVAVLLWIVSMNINNPQMSQTYTVPITILNLSNVNDNGMIILNEADITKQQVVVKIRATRNDLIALDESRIKATIDFSPVDVTNRQNIGKNVAVSVNVSVPSMSYEIVDYSSRTVEVVFDELTTKDLPIEISQSGNLANNFEIYGKPQISPEYVTIKGAKTYVDQAVNAKVNIDINEMTASINDQFEISVLDESGNSINDKFSLSSQSANVNVNIQKTASILIGTPSWEGEPMENYQVVGITSTPRYVEVIGDEDVISSIVFLEIPPINIIGASSDVVQVIDLNLILEPYGLMVQNGSENECTVTVKIEEVVTKVIQIPTQNIKIINIKDSDKAKLDMPSTFQVTITGPTSEIANFNPQLITCTADFSNYSSGDSDIEVDVLSSNLLIEVESPIRLRVLKEEVDIGYDE